MASDSYSISIVGNSNDSDLVLGSTSGYISETKSADLTNLESRTTALETSMNSVKTLSLGVAMGGSSSEAAVPGMIDEELVKLSHGKLRASLFVNPTQSPGVGPGGANPNDVSNGLVDGTLIWSGYALGNTLISQLPANGLASAYSGLSALELVDYYTSEQGKLDYEEIYGNSMFVGLPAAQIGPEAFGWSKTEITSLVDMTALSSIRMPGGLLRQIATNVYGSGVVGGNSSVTSMGVSNETYDFWEWNGLPGDEVWLGGNSPSALAKLKAGTTYKYYYPQSVHQETLLADIIMTKTNFNALTEQEQLWLREACANAAKKFYEYRLNGSITTENKIRNNLDGWSSGIQIQDTPLDIIQAFKAETIRLMDLSAATDISLSNMLLKLTDYAKRNAVNSKIVNLQGSVNILDNSVNSLETFVGDTRNVHLDKNLNGGLPMVNSILLRTDPSLTLLDLKFTPDPSMIAVGGRIISNVVNNGLNANSRRQYESKPTFNITKNGETLASSYVNKFYIGDLFTDKTFGFGDSFERMQSSWRGGIFRNHIAKDNSDNFIFIIGGGGIPAMANGWLDPSYVYHYERYFLDSASLLYNDLSSSLYVSSTPFVDPSNNIYNVNNNKKLLMNYSKNFYVDLNENMTLFEPNSTLLKGSNYPIYGSMEFDVSVNKNVVINDVSGFAFALNNLQLFDSMGNLQAHSDVSFNDDLNVMCFGSSLTGSDFNFTGSVYVVGYVNDLSSSLHQFNFAALGSINGNYDFSNQELNGKQNLYLNIMANESSKTSFFNNRTVLVSWDTTKPNVPKYVSLLPELVGNKISVYNKEIVMQI